MAGRSLRQALRLSNRVGYHRFDVWRPDRVRWRVQRMERGLNKRDHSPMLGQPGTAKAQEAVQLRGADALARAPGYPRPNPMLSQRRDHLRR